MPITVFKNSPSTDIRVPSTSRPSPTKNAVTMSRSATVMPTWSNRRAMTWVHRPVLIVSIHPSDGHRASRAGNSPSPAAMTFPAASLVRSQTVRTDPADAPRTRDQKA